VRREHQKGKRLSLCGKCRESHLSLMNTNPKKLRMQGGPEKKRKNDVGKKQKEDKRPVQNGAIKWLDAGLKKGSERNHRARKIRGAIAIEVWRTGFPLLKTMIQKRTRRLSGTLRKRSWRIGRL